MNTVVGNRNALRCRQSAFRMIRARVRGRARPGERARRRPCSRGAWPDQAQISVSTACKSSGPASAICEETRGGAGENESLTLGPFTARTKWFPALEWKRLAYLCGRMAPNGALAQRLFSGLASPRTWRPRLLFAAPSVSMAERHLFRRSGPSFAEPKRTFMTPIRPCCVDDHPVQSEFSGIRTWNAEYSQSGLFVDAKSVGLSSTLHHHRLGKYRMVSPLAAEQQA